MNKLTKKIKRNKKSIFALALASILTLSFNYSPIALVSDWMKKTASAYKSSSLQTYYANTTTSSESKVSSATFPKELEKYFEKTSNNFNILTYYNSRYTDLFANYVHEYLSNEKTGSTGYNATYQAFLEYKNATTLYDYYQKDTAYIKTTYGCDSFISYVEYFISHKTEWTITTDNIKEVAALFTTGKYRSEFYNALYQFINDPTTGTLTTVPSDPSGNYDYLPEGMKDEDFYKHSETYRLTKSLIDAEIVQTVAIYSYDGTTQNNNVAAIIAKDAPITSEFYYKDSTFEMENIPNVSFEMVNDHKKVYYFGHASNISTNKNYNSNYFVCTTADILDNALLQFRQVKPDEPDYIDATHPVYYKYSSVPYETTNEKFNLYVLDNDGVTPDEQATYDSLFIKPITQADIDADQANAVKLANGLYKNTNVNDLYFYYKIPYSTAANGSKYFKLVTNNYADQKFNSFCDFFAPDGNSRLYLKVKANQNYFVYYDVSENGDKSLNEFLTNNPSYNKKVLEVDFDLGTDENGDPINKEDYYEIPSSSYTGYYRDNYKLYFKKIKVFYQELVTDDSVYEKDANGYVFETKETPYIPFEMNSNIPAETYEMDVNQKALYALSDDSNFSYGGVNYRVVSQDTLDAAENRNFYVEVPQSVYDSIYGDNEVTTKFYYKHKTAEPQKQIYVLDDTKNAADNEVYKNLNYKVITTEHYKEGTNHKNYVAIAQSDANYNKNFKLYYKYDSSRDDADIYVQNEVKGSNAVYVIDDSLTYSDKTAYSLNLYTVLTSEEFNANSDFYVMISEDDDNYSTLYTKLYYKYQSTGEKEKIVYLYSSNKSDNYETFYSSNAGYVATDYKLVEPTLPNGKANPDYVSGLDLYYKKIRTETKKNIVQNTYIYFKTSSSVTLKENSFYALSFYVNTTGENVEASFYVNDSKNVLDEIKFEHVSTNGKWQKIVAFFATDTLSASSVTISMYMGDKNSILGSKFGDATIESISGSVLFDDISFTTINETDFTKRSIDEDVVETVEEHKKDDDDKNPTKVDVVIANDNNLFKDVNTYDYRTRSNVAVDIAGTWNNMFDFDSEVVSKFFNETKLKQITTDTDGFSPYDDLWQYYIGRDVSGQGNDLDLQQHQEAYLNNQLSVSVVKEADIDKTVIKADDEDEDEEDKKDESKEETDDEEKEEVKDVPYLQKDSTFKKNNSVLKIENKNRLISLGVASNYFELKQFEYYKITVWIYSPDEEASATISLNSVLKTASTQTHGSLITTSASINAGLTSYTTTPTNEYSWIPVSIYVEGNTLHNQKCSLVLEADDDSTVYFDNITIENISSSAYDTANSDSDSKTLCVSLTPSTSVVTNGITNGYFNTITLKENYKAPDYDYFAPKTAESWTANANNSTSVVAGIVPTSAAYTTSDLTKDKNFYNKYNNQNIPYSEDFDVTNSYNNLFGIYAPSTKDSKIEGAYETGIATTNSYKVYSSSISLSASTVYDISFDFIKGYQFKGDMIANLYYGSYDSAKIISTIKLNSDNLSAENWNTYHFYVETSTSSATVYLEIGISDATGTCFFKNAACTKSTKTLNEIRDELVLDSSNKTEDSVVDIFAKDDLKTIKFLDFTTLSSSIHTPEKDSDSNTYETKEYTNSITNTTAYTTGKTGVAVATFYKDDSVDTTYSVTIDKVTYYIGRSELEDGSEIYHLYKYSDCLPEDKVTEIGDLPVTVESFKKVIVGDDEYTSTSKEKINYKYTFNNDVSLNNVVIPGSELNNNYSENVLILANSYSTDYNIIQPVYTSTLNKTSFYVLKIYVKTSDFDNENFGLNINVSSISTKWTNINTTKIASESDAIDENGFVWYQTLIKTSENSVTSFGVTFSLGNEKSTGKGYAIIADIALETYSDEDSFDHYASTVEDDELTVKKYYSNSNSTNEDDSEDKEDENNLSWSTFFYIFSSVLLVLVMAVALIAVLLKKHPIKTSKKVENEHEKDLNLIQTTSSKKVDVKKAKAKKDDDTNNEGIV